MQSFQRFISRMRTSGAPRDFLLNMIAGVVAASVALFPSGAIADSSGMAADSIKVGGTVGSEAILRLLGASFTAQTGIAVKVVPGLASRGGLRAAADGVIDLAVVGNQLKADHIAKGLTLAFGGRTPFVFVTSNRNPGDLRSTDVADIIGKPNAKWPDGTPIRIILRQKLSTETILMTDFFPELGAALDAARRRSDVPITNNDGDSAELAEETPGSILPATYLQIVTEKRKLRMISIDGIAPTMENFETGKYRYAKQLYFVVRKPPGASTERFVAFLRSAEAQQIMRGAGLIPNGND
jgi:phosphate transport system substrate-binding protein